MTMQPSPASPEAPTRRTLESRAPATGERLGDVPVAIPTDVTGATARARKAQAAWSLLPVAERCERLLRLRDALVERADEVVDVVARECGKPRQEALGLELMVTADLLTYYCKHAPRILAPRELSLHLLPHKRSEVQAVARGVVGVIAARALPLVVPMSSVVAALVAGNAVVLKPSEFTPLTASKVKEIFDGTGLPEDLFGVVHGGPDVGAALVESGVGLVVFTGTTANGRRVASTCGANLVPCILQLSGKAPLLACNDCDLERTARAIVFGAFVAAGQTCTSVERVYAHEAIHDALLARVRELTMDIRQGDPSESTEVEVGALTSVAHVEAVEALVADAVARGAEVVVGGKRRPVNSGTFFEPTVIARTTHAMRIMREEIAGPVVAFRKVASDDEAIALANETRHGLEAYVFTKDRARGAKLAARLEAGTVLVNDVAVSYGAAEAPFGGIKDSGFGRVHGDDALRAMTYERHVSVARIPERTREALWFPYSEKMLRWERRALDTLFSRAPLLRRLGRFF